MVSVFFLSMLLFASCGLKLLGVSACCRDCRVGVLPVGFGGLSSTPKPYTLNPKP